MGAEDLTPDQAHKLLRPSVAEAEERARLTAKVTACKTGLLRIEEVNGWASEVDVTMGDEHDEASGGNMNIIRGDGEHDEASRRKKLNDYEEKSAEARQIIATSAPEPKSPKSGPGPAPATATAGEDEIRAVGEEIRQLKEKLKRDGITGKGLNENDQVKTLVCKFQELKAGAAAQKSPESGRVPAPATSAASKHEILA